MDFPEWGYPVSFPEKHDRQAQTVASQASDTFQTCLKINIPPQFDFGPIKAPKGRLFTLSGHLLRFGR